MRMRMEKRREGIVSLTQTELMLVLAVVVLLLLLIKNNQLLNVCEKMPEVCSELSIYSDRSDGTAGQLTEEQLDKEVSDNLAVGADGAPSDASPSLGQAAKENKNAALKEAEESTAAAQKQQQAETEVQKLRDENAKLKSENASLRLQKQELEFADSVRELREEGTGLDEELAAKNTENQQQQGDKEIQKLRDENAALKKENADFVKQDSQRVVRESKSSLRDEVGFLPCWLGSGKPRYYFTFALTYYPKSDTFAIKRHSHWNSKAAVVQAALTGGLRVLNDYPKKAVSRNAFLKFARQVDAAKNRLYGKECRLAVTINKKDVDLTVTNDFINNKAGFYPVGQ